MRGSMVTARSILSLTVAGWAQPVPDFSLEDIRIAQPDWGVEIVIINPANRTQYTSVVSSATTLPWLQDTAEESVWTRWGRSKDELCIVDTQGRIVTVTNLGYANLEDPRNLDALSAALLTAARAVDVDSDSLPDVWEDHYFGSLAPDPTDDSDEDGQNTSAEFAFGTSPKSAHHASRMDAPLLRPGNPSRLLITFRRRTGALLDYRLESSPDFQTWHPLPAQFVSTSEPQNLHDGSGMAETQVALRLDPSLGDVGFIRLRVQPRP